MKFKEGDLVKVIGSFGDFTDDDNFTTYTKAQVKKFVYVVVTCDENNENPVYEIARQGREDGMLWEAYEHEIDYHLKPVTDREMKALYKSLGVKQ